jgi:uncharacterized glyoxalase superfamily protein PhnB
VGHSPLIEFTMNVFGTQELVRVPGPDGNIGRAEYQIGGLVVMMFDARHDWPDTPHSYLMSGSQTLTHLWSVPAGDRRPLSQVGQ